MSEPPPSASPGGPRDPPAEAAHLQRQADVRDAMRQAGAPHASPKTRGIWLELGGYALLALLFAAARVAVHRMDLPTATRALIARLATGAIALTVITAVSRAIHRLLVVRTADPVYRFNLQRVLQL